MNAGEPMPSTVELSRKQYEKELLRLQTELVRMQEWIVADGRRLVVLFEGRDTAGKDGVIKRVTEFLNPRTCRVVAIPAPSERERTQWYFQRYVAQLPAAGEIVLFDRSWYNRAGVERVMGFCTEEEYEEFLRFCPQFEQTLMNDGIVLVKYWLSVSDSEQERRFEKRLTDPRKRWKFSPIDLQARARWVDYAEAKDRMFARTDTEASPWYVVEADDKRTARLNLISHLLSLVRVRAPRREGQAREAPAAPAAQVQAPAQANRADRARTLRRCALAEGCVSALRGEALVHRAHGARTLADGGGDALHRAVADVAGGEHAGHGRLKWQRRRCPRGQRPHQLTIGEHEPILVEQHAVTQPARRGLRADEAEQPRAGNRLLLAGRGVPQRHLVQMILTRKCIDFDAGQEVDLRDRPRFARSGTGTCSG